MPTIRRVRTSQPQSAVGIDWSNPLTRGLCALVTNVGGVLYEHTTGQIFSGIKKPRTRSIRKYAGASASIYDDTAAGAPLARKTKADDISGASKIFVFAEITPQNSAFVPIIASSESGNGYGWSLYSDDYTYDYNQVAFGYNISNYTTSGGGSLGANFENTAHRVAFAYDGTYRYFWEGGRLIGSSAYTFNPTAHANRRLWIGRLPDGKYGQSGLSFSAVYDRMPSAAEIAAIFANPWQVFKPRRLTFGSVVTAQFARPASDVSAGTWTASSGSDLYAMLDETSASDTDYIITSAASTCEVALTSLSDPASSAGHIVRYRISATAGGITVRLRQGSTTIATWTHATAPTSLTTYEQTLTSGEANSITDYTALKLQFEAT